MSATPIPNFLGCYTDDDGHDLEFGPKTAGFNASSCMAACPSYKYVALQNGVCYCDAHRLEGGVVRTLAPDACRGARRAAGVGGLEGQGRGGDQLAAQVVVELFQALRHYLYFAMVEMHGGVFCIWKREQLPHYSRSFRTLGVETG